MMYLGVLFFMSSYEFPSLGGVAGESLGVAWLRGLSVYRARVSRGTRSGARSRACVCALGSCVVAGSRCWRLGEARARACEWLNRQCAGWSRHDAWARSDCGGVGGFEQGVVGASEARQQGDQEHVRHPQRVQEVVDRVEVKVLDLCSDLTNWRHGQEKVASRWRGAARS